MWKMSTLFSLKKTKHFNVEQKRKIRFLLNKEKNYISIAVEISELFLIIQTKIQFSTLEDEKENE